MEEKLCRENPFQSALINGILYLRSASLSDRTLSFFSPSSLLLLSSASPIPLLFSIRLSSVFFSVYPSVSTSPFPLFTIHFPFLLRILFSLSLPDFSPLFSSSLPLSLPLYLLLFLYSLPLFFPIFCNSPPFLFSIRIRKRKKAKEKKSIELFPPFSSSSLPSPIQKKKEKLTAIK